MRYLILILLTSPLSGFEAKPDLRLDPKIKPVAYNEDELLDDLFHFKKKCPTVRKHSMRISKNFTLNEFIKSPTAKQHGINNRPNSGQIDLIILFAERVLQPLRDMLGPIEITSGFRSSSLNELVGGARQSAHLIEGGFIAADIRASSATLMDIVKMVDKMRLPVSQVILEPTWVHISSHQILLKGPTYLKAEQQPSGRFTYSCLPIK